ncbi:unhealthy ribosome biogenesis protein 2 homolog [Syngnathoides biaculeatus]|uniref:unhealthy ribosome biogenesis protein 2 homolog n=1 Tax=Syngnathoides biaculeatus TaxID=300417 RepID=UPI002ADDF2CD|nr:unhealthy ribosome biogenesis protein 2 homolog [Syngnathoides biaculeatus]XP_061670323.1 unhealthy ribosome biogenesis protein 2 homolog [Syngnathoides biaculeatus]XP_061670324.1 unhealthy ribosome biogenesis protein 2 homolog [Syngnathoides biaculeatus]XP_061670325.1 unhealthy ribosome biogenesis protein 2 homolog [Syngnathoides biaculeatus]
MAAIYSGIHLKLKSPQTPWEDKLKLARFAWISSQCLLPNKEQVLLDWCTYALTGWYNKKVEFSQTVLEGLWSCLDAFLHSQKLHVGLKQGKTVSMRLNMAQLLLDLLEECAVTPTRLSVGVPTLLSVCQGILSSSLLSSVFTTKFELMVSLSVKVCSFACHQLEQGLPSGSRHSGLITDTMSECFHSVELDSQTEVVLTQELDERPKENSTTTHLFEFLLQVLTSYLSVQRQQANPNRVFALVTNQLIQPLLLLRHMLTSAEYVPSHTHLSLRQQLCRDVRVRIDSILQLSLFSADLLASYKDELLPSKDDSGKRGHGGTKGPLRPANALLCKLCSCQPPLMYSVKSNTVPLLFKFFLQSYRKCRVENEEEQRMLCFKFLTMLVPALDLSPSNISCTPESWNLALLAAESLLSQALSADIYNVAADRIRHGEVQLKFYKSLAQVLFNQAQPSIPAWYRCLKVLLGLNHMLLETDLDELLSSAWVHADSMEARVQRARQLMLCSLFQTYTKLRQLPHFFSELLSVICQPSPKKVQHPLLSDCVSASLRASILDSPPSQGLAICSVMLENMGKYILPGLVKEGSEAEKMELEGVNGEAKGDGVREETSMKLFSLSKLLHVVLFSLKTLDNVSPLPLVRQGQSMMEEMQRFLDDLLQLLPTESKTMKAVMNSVSRAKKKSKKNVNLEDSQKVTASLWEEKTREAVLLLRYTWIEVDTLFHIYCSKYTPFDSNAEALTSIENLLNCELNSVRLQPCSSISFVYLRLLIMQQIKKVLLDSFLLAEPSTLETINRAVEFISAKDELRVCSEGDQVWDGQVYSVDSSSCRVAHWYFVVSNLPLLAPYLSREDVNCIADVVVDSLLCKQSSRGKDQLSVSFISSELIHSSVLVELPPLFSATVGMVSERIFEVLTAAHAPNVCLTLDKYQEAQKGEMEPLSLLVKQTIVNDILVSSQSGQVFVLLSEAQTKEVVDLLQILSSLHPDGLSSENLSSIFLLLTFMLTSTASYSEAPDTASCCAGFQAKLFRILGCLVEGKNFPGVLKIIHGSALLEAIVSSLLWHSKEGRFSATSSSDWLDLMKALQDFIVYLVQLIVVRNSSVRLNLDRIASYLSSKDTTSKLEGSVMSVHLLLASLAASSKAMTSNLGRNKQMDQTLIQTIARTTSSLGSAVESVVKAQYVNEPDVQPACSLSPAYVVDTVTIMLQCKLSYMTAGDEEKTILRHETLYQGFCQQILKEINSAARPVDFLVSSLNFLSVRYLAVTKLKGKEKEEEEGKKKSVKEVDELYAQIIKNVHRLLTAPWLSPSDTSELEPALQNLLRHLLENSTPSQFSMLLTMIEDGLDTCKLSSGNYKEVLAGVIIVKLLSCCQLPEPSSKALWFLAPQILSAMVFLVRSSSQDVGLSLTFTIPTVTAMTTLLRQGEGLISNPHHVVLVLGALQAVPLDHLTPLVYQSVFFAIHEALFAIIQCHSQVMLNATPSFLNVFYRLVASIMQEGRQRGVNDAGGESEIYLQCSRLVERMYSHIAAISENFTTLSAFMVAQYVTALQKVTLRPEIKLHLTEGIYQILDLCVEQDIKFLTASLQAGVREVFSELYSNYTHYHKPQRQGEDKYTV